MKKKGFTLIELLAVIIILGILMLVAVPSVTTYINNSRKGTYVDTIQQIIKGAVAKANSGDLEMFDTDTTYYVPVSAIQMENGKLKSPYGDVEDAYVVVTYDGENYDYYFVGKDTGNMGIGEITKMEVVNKDMIGEVGEIPTNVGIEGKSKIVVFGEDLVPGAPTTATTHVSGNGHVGSGGGHNSNYEPGNCSINKEVTTCSRYPTPAASTRYGMTAYFDPVSSSTCNASNAGSGTCYTWHQIGTSGDNVILLSEESLGETFWLTDEDSYNLENYEDSGPYTLLNFIKNNTTNWTRVPLLNYTYQMSFPTDPAHPAYDRYSTGYNRLICTNGDCKNDYDETLVTGLRARVITGEEYRDIINDAITYQSETPAISASWTSAGGIEYLFDDTEDGVGSYNCLVTYNETSFTGNSNQTRMGSYADTRYHDCDNNRDISWLNDDEAWTLTQENDGYGGYAYTYCELELDSEHMRGFSYVGSEDVLHGHEVYPVITVPRSQVTFA